MAANDHLAPRQFHGTNAKLSPGDSLLPRNARTTPAGHDSIGDWVWSTDDKQWASAHGKHTYEVEHQGLSTRNPGIHGATVSLGAKVIKEV